MLDPAVRWRLDKDEVSSIFTRMRCNLMGKRLQHPTWQGCLSVIPCKVEDCVIMYWKQSHCVRPRPSK